MDRYAEYIMRTAGLEEAQAQAGQSRGIDPPVAIRRGEGAQMKCCRELRFLNYYFRNLAQFYGSSLLDRPEGSLLNPEPKPYKDPSLTFLF